MSEDREIGIRNAEWKCMEHRAWGIVAEDGSQKTIAEDREQRREGEYDVLQYEVRSQRTDKRGRIQMSEVQWRVHFGIDESARLCSPIR